MAGNPPGLHAVIFEKKLWTTRQARAWMRAKGWKPVKRVDVTENFYRYRLRSPKQFKRFRTKRLPGGVQLILGFR